MAANQLKDLPEWRIEHIASKGAEFQSITPSWAHDEIPKNICLHSCPGHQPANTVLISYIPEIISPCQCHPTSLILILECKYFRTFSNTRNEIRFSLSIKQPRTLTNFRSYFISSTAPSTLMISGQISSRTERTWAISGTMIES